VESKLIVEFRLPDGALPTKAEDLKEGVSFLEKEIKFILSDALDEYFSLRSGDYEGKPTDRLRLAYALVRGHVSLEVGPFKVKVKEEDNLTFIEPNDLEEYARQCEFLVRQEEEKNNG